MRKDVQLKLVLLLMLFIGVFTACSDDDEKIKMGDPDFVFNSETGEYKVKMGKEVALQVSVKDALNPVYSWKQEGVIVASDTIYHFKGDRLGEYFVNFRVDADNGNVEKQAKVTVVDRLTPEIKVASAAVAYCGVEKVFAAETDYTDATTIFEWTYNGVETRDSIFHFKEEDMKVYELLLKVTNEDGVAIQKIDISVIEEEEPFMYFDDGNYVLPSTLNKLKTLTCPIGRNLVLAPIKFMISDLAVYEWKVDGVVQNETSIYLNFTPEEEGKTYAIEVTAKDGAKTASAKVNVLCCPAEGTYFKKPTLASNYISNKCYKFIPAPGQFVNFSAMYSENMMANQIQTQLNQGKGDGGYLASLGAWGGYMILQFDHSVKNNRDGKPDFNMTGNPLPTGDWNECGVVWVSQDVNGNGIPDDTWYEVKGSAYGQEGVTQRYAMKYYRPVNNDYTKDILCIDNSGKVYFLNRNKYHSGITYFPMGIGKKDKCYILTGTCLGNQFESGGLEVNWGFDWGYVDNINDPDGFRIDNAIQQDGSPANLDYIDFVKVHTGQLGQGKAVGEVSTESSAAIDLRLKEERNK